MKRFVAIALVLAMTLGLIGPISTLFTKDNHNHIIDKDILSDNSGIEDNDGEGIDGPEVVGGLGDSIEEEEVIDYLFDTTFVDDNGKTIIKNVNDILVLVNKTRALPSDYKPDDLIVPNVRFSFTDIVDKKHLRKEAGLALEEMFAQAEEDGIILYGISGYRSYGTQKYLFDNKVSQVGEEKAKLVVAYPGQSEHQTGLTIDVSAKSSNYGLETSFGKTPEGIWVKENSYKFGFIIRYEEDTTHITGYSFEPWHIRYVGREAAKDIFERGITLEEFLGSI